MSTHHLRITTSGGIKVSIECGWDSRRQHYYLDIEDDRFPPCNEEGDELDQADWPTNLIMFSSKGKGGTPLSLMQVKAKFEEFGASPPAALLVQLQLEQEQNLGGYYRNWRSGVVTSVEPNYCIELSQYEVDPHLLGENAPQSIVLDSTQQLDRPRIRQRLRELNITHGHTLIIEVALTLGADVTIGDDVLFQGSGNRQPAKCVRVGAGCRIETGVLINQGCVIGKGVRIGEHTEIVQEVQLEDQAQIGVGCWIERGAHIGAGAQIGAGARIRKRQQVPTGAIIAAKAGWKRIAK